MRTDGYRSHGEGNSVGEELSGPSLTRQNCYVRTRPRVLEVYLRPSHRAIGISDEIAQVCPIESASFPPKPHSPQGLLRRTSGFSLTKIMARLKTDLREAIERAEFAAQMSHQRAMRNAFARHAADQFRLGHSGGPARGRASAASRGAAGTRRGGTSLARSPRSRSACSKSWAAYRLPSE